MDRIIWRTFGGSPASMAGYDFIPIMLDGGARKRRARKKRQGYAVPQATDVRLRDAAKRLGYSRECHVINTTKLCTKREGLGRIIWVIDGL